MAEWFSTVYGALNAFTTQNPFLVLIGPFLIVWLWRFGRRIIPKPREREVKRLTARYLLLLEAKRQKRADVIIRLALDFADMTYGYAALLVIAWGVHLFINVLLRDGLPVTEFVPYYIVAFYVNRLGDFANKARQLLYHEKYLSIIAERLTKLDAEVPPEVPF